jgi:proline iminopeptidase
MVISVFFVVYSQFGIKYLKLLEDEQMQNGYATLEKISLGGINQWISIRAKDVKNPILLYLHGGPGTPVMPLFRHFQAPLEDFFIVVQ